MIEQSITMSSGVDAIIKGNKESIKKSILITASTIASEAKSLAPVNKKPGLGGQLRGSISFGFIDDKTAFASANTEYAAYVEFGTRYQAPQPYMRPAKMLAEGKSVGRIKAFLFIATAKSAIKRKIQKVFK